MVYVVDKNSGCTIEQDKNVLEIKISPNKFLLIYTDERTDKKKSIEVYKLT